MPIPGCWIFFWRQKGACVLLASRNADQRTVFSKQNRFIRTAFGALWMVFPEAGTHPHYAGLDQIETASQED